LKEHIGESVTARLCIDEDELEKNISLSNFSTKYVKLLDGMYLIDGELGKPPVYPSEWVWRPKGSEFEVIFASLFILIFFLYLFFIFFVLKVIWYYNAVKMLSNKKIKIK